MYCVCGYLCHHTSWSSNTFGEKGHAALKCGVVTFEYLAATFIIMFSLVINLTIHFAGNDTVYWTDMGLNRISRAKRDQTWREDIITTGISRVEGIAVDWIAGE